MTVQSHHESLVIGRPFAFPGWMRCVWFLLVLPFALLWVYPQGPRPAAAEDESHEETEHRLKTAGIEPALREDIHAAIRKGVAALRKIQSRRGAILGQGGLAGQGGQTVLGGLALTHAAIPEGAKGGRLALEWLMDYRRKELRDNTYQAGLGCMLFQANRVKHAEHKFLLLMHDRLRRAPKSDHGYWGYRSGGSGNTSNLSTAQFACLGLWAAERAGAKPATKAWKLHLDTLLKAQQANGSWGYYAPDYPFHRALSGTYPTGTFMALANVALAREALGESIADHPEYDARVHIAVAKGKAALRRHTQWILTAQAAPGLIGHYPYYRLYALEKVCIFLDLEDLGGVRWYEEGARWLLSRQLPKAGGWSTTGAIRPDDARLRVPGFRTAALAPNAQFTSFALLFLLRASAAYHPITPRPIGRPKVVTPSGAASTEADDAPPAKRAPPLVLVRGALGRLEQALDGRQLKVLRPVLDALRLVGRVYASSRTKDGFASAGHEVWARRVDDTLLRLAIRFRTAKANDRLLWQAIALESLAAMADLHPRVGPRLMESVLAVERDKTFPPPFRYAWYASAIETLRRLAPPGLARWLADRAVSDDPHLAWRTSAALTALGGLAPRVPGRTRYAIARSVWRHLTRLTRRSGGDAQTANLMRDLQVLVHRLAAAGKGGALPPVATLHPGDAVNRLERWWRSHDKPDDPLWR